MGTTNIIVLDNWYWEWVQLTFTIKLTTDLLKIRNLPAFIRIFTVQLPEVIRKCSFNWFWTVSSRDFLDLFDRQYMNGRTTPDFHLYWLTRSAGFFPMENTPFGLEHFSPITCIIFTIYHQV